jgi:site-specific recombinase XerD
VCCLWPKRYGSSLIRHAIRERFRTACKPLNLERLRGLTVHHGRHTFVNHALAGGRTLAEVKAAAGHASLVTFVSHALAGGRTLAEVKAAAGHVSLVTTSVYLHVAVDDDAVPGRLFAAKRDVGSSA